MQEAKTAVSRIEFRTNLMRANAPIIRLGFLVECCWDDFRWMGMIYRPALTPNELKASNLETWPELLAPEPLLRSLFDKAWESADGEGGAALAELYGCLSAFHVAIDEANSSFADGLSSELDDGELDAKLYARLRQFEARLEPACQAEVISLPGTGGIMVKKTEHKVAAAA